MENLNDIVDTPALTDVELKVINRFETKLKKMKLDEVHRQVLKEGIQKKLEQGKVSQTVADSLFRLVEDYARSAEGVGVNPTKSSKPIAEYTKSGGGKKAVPAKDERSSDEGKKPASDDGSGGSNGGDGNIDVDDSTPDDADTSDIDDTGKKPRWLGILLAILKFIVLLPFRIVNFILRFFWSILNWLLLITVLATVVGIIICTKVMPMYQEASQQAYDKLSTLNESSFQKLENTTVFDKDGKVIGTIDAGDYHYVDINDISKYVQWGYISTEDKRFTEHCGIDIQSLARAGLSLVKHNGEITQGGSTITQQVIKNCLLTQEQSYSRKLVEVLLAPKIEQRFSKDKVMEFYCNTNYYGNLCYGIDTASRYYFGKPCTELTLGEAAMLCGVSNSPNNYNPVASMELAIQKRDQVLGNMLSVGYITQEEYEEAKQKKIKLKVEDNGGTSDNYMVSFAIHCTALELLKKDGFVFQYVFPDSKTQKAYEKKYSQAYKEKSSLIRSGGYKIYTSFDMGLQKKLQKSIDTGLKGYKDKQSNGKFAMQGAGVCVDNETGYIVAMVGGRGTKDEFNRAFLSARQPGSTIKPLLDYAPVINEGIMNPSTIVTDKPVYSIEGDTSSYSPKNSSGGYRGDMKLREGLARSLNTIAYQIYKKVGSERAINYLNQMHFSSMSFADNTAESLALGGFTNGCKVFDMAKGYATLAMGGAYTTRTCIRRIDFQGTGKVFESPELEKTQTEVYTKDTAFMVTDMMQGTVEEDYGTGHAWKNKDMIVAGKTGTTSSNKDAWFCGYTKFYTTSIWVGYDTPKTMTGMYGGTVPASIWFSYMEKIPKNMDATDFDKPETVSLRHVTGSGDYTGSDLAYKDGKRWYSLHSGGKEWFSELNRTKYNKNDKETALQDAINRAKKAVENFIGFSIMSAQEALELDERYSDCLATIEEIPDEYKQLKYKEQAAEHYDLLSGEVKSTWLKQIREYNKKKSEQALADAKTKAEDSLHNAKAQLKQTRIDKAEWFINTLSERHYYTDVTKELINQTKEAVERLKGYSEYKNYKTRCDYAVSRAKKLPKPPKEEPKVPEDKVDKVPIDEDSYVDDAENTEED